MGILIGGRLLMATVFLAASGCSAIQALQEPASTVATVQRMNNIERALQHSERLLLRTPVQDGASWLDEMTVTSGREAEITSIWKETAGGSIEGVNITWPDIIAYAWADLGRELATSGSEEPVPAAARELEGAPAETREEREAPPHPGKKPIINPYDEPKKKGIINPYEEEDKGKKPGGVINPYGYYMLPAAAARFPGAKASGDGEEYYGSTGYNPDQEPGQAETDGSPVAGDDTTSATSRQVADNLIALLGGRIPVDFNAWKALLDQVAATMGEIEKLKAEAKGKDASAAKKESAKKSIEVQKALLKEQKKQADAAFKKLLTTMKSAQIDCRNELLLRKALRAFSYMNRLYAESASLGVVLLYHYARSLPNVANEVEPAVKGWVNESLREQGVENPVEAASRMTFKIEMKGLDGPPTIGIDGAGDLQTLDPVTLVASVTQKAGRFIGDVFIFPGKFGVVMAKVAEQRKFISAATDLIEGQCGIKALPSVTLEVSTSGTVSASVGMR